MYRQIAVNIDLFLPLLFENIGVWRSWLARHVRDVEVEGSSPFTPTNKNEKLKN